MTGNILTVSEINGHVKMLLDSDFLLAGVYVKGELSNYKAYPSGHHYFTMKDSEAALRCVMFKSSAQKLKYRPENGMRAVAFGRVTVYPRDGVYQLYVESLMTDGVGELYYAYEKLKEKLQKEGLFDSVRKKPLPKYPNAIALITSSAGAAAHIAVARVPNLVQNLKYLKTKGCWIWGADMNGADVRQADLTGAAVWVLGGEGKGLSRLVRETCDGLVSLPMGGRTGSLNVSVAGGILLYQTYLCRNTD